MKDTLKITKALADTQRLRILMMLKDGELCVCHVIDVLKLAPSTVSRHLSVLTEAGLVEYRKNGRWIHYRLASGNDAVMAWLTESLKGSKAISGDRKALANSSVAGPECTPKPTTSARRPRNAGKRTNVKTSK